MPEDPNPKHRPHPIREVVDRPPRREEYRPALRGYAELEVTTNYTFLTGASHPEELVYQAALLGMSAIAITDTNSLAGIVRAHVAAKEAGIQLVVGTRLVLGQSADLPAAGPELLVYPTDRAAYGRLCQLLTIGKRRAHKGGCWLSIDDLRAHNHGLLAISVPPAEPKRWDGFAGQLYELVEVFGGSGSDRLSLATHRPFDPHDDKRLETLAEWSARFGLPLVATNAVLYNLPERRPLQDVLTCIRLGTTVQQAGYALEANSERHLKPPDEMGRLFRGAPAAIARTLEIAERAKGFNLDQIRYEYPHEITPPGLTPSQHLRSLTWQGAAERYPGGVPDRIRYAIKHELDLIDELQYAAYFLTVQDLVQFARGRGILCQGRGAAANSAVCFCLGVTSVDPDRIDLLFERFISKERNEPPDIDIDFEHERREEVLQYVYNKYGRERAALTAEVITYRGRSAVREVGKALGLSHDSVDKLAGTLDWWDGGTVDPERIRELGLNPDDRTIKLLLYLSAQILGFPRHLSQHVGGFVITNTPLSELVPIENAAMPDRTVIEWDKDDIDAMGMLKVDCLGLGMLTCVRKCFDLIEQHYSKEFTLATIPPEDPLVYDMICNADTVGVFQIESRAQMAMLPRLRPRTFYDLVIEVAIVRPGPIQGKMVHPYLKRRSGEEPIVFPNEAVREVLGRTLGVPLFQEQAMKLAIVAGGFTPGEADQLRRAMAAWKRKGDAIARFGEKLVQGMRARGYDADFADRCFEQIKGFSSYGFPESHAASFALLVYSSSWQKRHYPAAFAAALLNSQPMGFYQPAQIIRDAQQHGVEVRPIDINASQWDCTLERQDDESQTVALRLGMRLIAGLSEAHAERIRDAREADGSFASVDEFRRRTGLRVGSLQKLASADAYRSIGVDRQQAIWAIQSLHDDDLPLFDGQVVLAVEDAAALPIIDGWTQVRHDIATTGVSLKAHPLSFLRSGLNELGVTLAKDIQDQATHPSGKPVKVAGTVLIRQRPGTAIGVLFITIEDETGIANLVVWPKVFERFRAAARHAAIILATGRIERAGAVVHVVVNRIDAVRQGPEPLKVVSRDFH